MKKLVVAAMLLAFVGTKMQAQTPASSADQPKKMDRPVNKPAEQKAAPSQEKAAPAAASMAHATTAPTPKSEMKEKKADKKQSAHKRSHVQNPKVEKQK